MIQIGWNPNFTGADLVAIEIEFESVDMSCRFIVSMETRRAANVLMEN